MGNNDGAPRGQKSKDDALSLVRRLPISFAASLQMRKRTKMPLQKPMRTVWAELRGSTILFYQLPEGVKTSSPRSSRAGDGAASNATGSAFRTPRGSKVNTLLSDEQFSSGKVSAEDITLIPLQDAVIKSVDKKGVLMIKCTANEEAITYELKPAAVDFDRWMRVLNSSKSQRTVGLSDFEIQAALGKGASGKVFLVRDKLTNEELALKVIEKSVVYETNDAYRHALDERLVLELACEHPFILNLFYAFQSDKRLYLVTEYCAGHDLFDYLKARGRPLPERRARRVVAEILLALEHVHSLGVIYRDLKLENVLLDAQGHVRVADFGLSKIVTTPEGDLLQDQSGIKVQGARTFCGTREYVAPEMLVGKQYGQSVDLWALGILLYEILCGRTPFYASNRDEVYDRIESAPLKFPRHLSSEVVSLIRGLLDRNPKTRLGMGSAGMNEVKSHPFFKDLNWSSLYDKPDHVDNLVMSPEPTADDAKDFEGIDKDELGFWIEDEREVGGNNVSSRSNGLWSMFTPSKSQRSRKSAAAGASSGGIAGYEFSGNSSLEGSRQHSRSGSRNLSRANSTGNTVSEKNVAMTNQGLAPDLRESSSGLPANARQTQHQTSKDTT
ncbi:RAC-beta serine/threonine-protein kinase [Porphyridium purpureum]|uniref:RAC-beta serine/threonine-protein kinase n=1 Tax=Porphyridium purpureum TaxID=35688 RepID=A0A5J4Z0I1_PORPP|nr:RAC-beta serine/threonine-protein kinase [Porphyridium purpureum]|eukprot:POR4526..scf208_2